MDFFSNFAFDDGHPIERLLDNSDYFINSSFKLLLELTLTVPSRHSLLQSQQWKH